MEIKFFGGNSVKLSYRKTSIVVDDISRLGQKSIVTDRDIQIITDTRYVDKSKNAHFVIDGPGEFEVSDVSITGIPARSHLDVEGVELSTVYRVIIDDIRIGVIGNIHPDLSEEQAELLGTIDLLFVPVGGNGFTLDPIGAQKIIQKVEPKIIVPTHYDDSGLNFEVPQRTLDDGIKELAMEPADTVEVLKLKNIVFGETSKLIVVTRK